MARLDSYGGYPEGMDKYLSFYGWHFSKKIPAVVTHLKMVKLLFNQMVDFISSRLRSGTMIMNNR